MPRQKSSKPSDSDARIAARPSPSPAEPSALAAEEKKQPPAASPGAGQGGATMSPSGSVGRAGSLGRPGSTEDGAPKPQAKRVSAKKSSQDGSKGVLKEASAPATEIGATYRPSYEEISTRAYFIYLERGATPGDPMADWMQAERELIEARRKP